MVAKLAKLFSFHGTFKSNEIQLVQEITRKLTSQLRHDVRTTLNGRCYDVKMLKRRPYNVVLTSYVGWDLLYICLLYTSPSPRDS